METTIRMADAPRPCTPEFLAHVRRRSLPSTFRALLQVFLLVLSLFGVSCNLIGGAFDGEPEQLAEQISDRAQTLIDQAFDGLQGDRLRDYHVHMLGMNTELNGTWVNEDW